MATLNNIVNKKTGEVFDLEDTAARNSVTSLKESLKPVATSGSYNDLTDKPADMGVSKKTGNILTVESDGLYVPESATEISKLDNNAIEQKSDGIYAEKVDTSEFAPAKSTLRTSSIRTQGYQNRSISTLTFDYNLTDEDIFNIRIFKFKSDNTLTSDSLVASYKDVNDIVNRHGYDTFSISGLRCQLLNDNKTFRVTAPNIETGSRFALWADYYENTDSVNENLRKLTYSKNIIYKGRSYYGWNNFSNSNTSGYGTDSIGVDLYTDTLDVKVGSLTYRLSNQGKIEPDGSSVKSVGSDAMGVCISRETTIGNSPCYRAPHYDVFQSVEDELENINKTFVNEQYVFNNAKYGKMASAGVIESLTGSEPYQLPKSAININFYMVGMSVKFDKYADALNTSTSLAWITVNIDGNGLVTFSGSSGSIRLTYDVTTTIEDEILSNKSAISNFLTEDWVFELEDGTTVTKKVVVNGE